ncbi:hypothetical protein SAMN05444409_0503 [Epilithonimonas zeae]|uniref:Uncharacterized protein n=1 Tax=Epilithonimonas zeae TaxID=1416779 RepID=A0A1N6ED87_9FLAO|nr:hypothetical protein SAMN05444409_0503 [Epilithonimonas zeae]
MLGDQCLFFLEAVSRFPLILLAQPQFANACCGVSVTIGASLQFGNLDMEVYLIERLREPQPDSAENKTFTIRFVTFCHPEVFDGLSKCPTHN